MDDVDFTDDEIIKELEILGYKDVPQERFRQFKRELFHLIRQERSQNGSINSSDSSLSYAVDPLYPARQQTAVRSNGAGYTGSSGDHYRVASSGSSREIDPLTYKLASDGGSKENFKNSGAGDAEGRAYRPSVHHSDHLANRSVQSDTHVLHSAREVRPRGAKSDLDLYSEGHADLSQKRQMKRKVLRKLDDGQVSICESVTESESDDVTSLQEQLRNAALDHQYRPVSAPPDVRRSHDDHRLDQRRPHTACREPTFYNLPEDYQGPKALIRPMSCDPHMRNIKKTDPVARYQEYRHGWKACRAPGEKAHKQLRWGVREKMLYHDHVVEKKPQRSYQPNAYVVPSDKKRKNLRWQIRNDLANGIKPPSVFD